MRAVIQRVTKAEITIDHSIYRNIEKGLVILLGIEEVDNNDDIMWMSNKIVNMRIFADQEEKMNKSLLDVRGDLLLVSQFTLLASTKKGNRPSFIKAARPEKAIPIYNDFVNLMKEYSNGKVITGEFGSYMNIKLENDGPVTIIIDSKTRE